MANHALIGFAATAVAASFILRDGGELFFYGSLISVLVALAFLAPHQGMRWFRRVEVSLRRLSRNRGIAIVTVGVLTLIVVTLVTAIAKVPIPKVDDEFSYLLAADTFAHGRLTNPTHPMWMHFEAFHVIQQPTYASRYPPGQGLILGLGQLLGHPIIGVWVSAILAAGAMCWMLMAWLPTRWALIGSIFVVVHPELLIWSQRYWGGSLTLAGGALAIGGCGRVLKKLLNAESRLVLRDSTVMAIGMSILLLCRPYEGGVLILILLLVCAFAFAKSTNKPIQSLLTCVVSPLIVLLGITMAWLAYYNWRVTNNPFRMPQQVYVATYNAAPIFLWQKRPVPPVYHNKQMRDFHMGWELRHYLKQRSLSGLAIGMLERLGKILRGMFRLWPLLIPLLALPAALKNRWTQLALLILTLFASALLQVTWTFFHYAAPALPLFFLVIVQSLRHLRLWHWHGKPVGLFLARGCIILSVLSLPYTCWTIAQENRYARRAKIVAQLQRQGGKHLIVVRYAPTTINPVEWVYNAADIDRAPIVWARELGAAQDRDLVRYFGDRRVWLLEVNNRDIRLVPYLSNFNL